MMIEGLVIFPAFWLLAGALILPLLPKNWRAPVFLAAAGAALLHVLSLPDGTAPSIRMMSYELIPLRADPLSRIFGLIFSFITLAGGIYAFRLKEAGQQCAALFYAGGALGATFAGDLFTLFVFWEMMAVASTYLIWARRTTAAWRAGFRYLIYHLIGGGILFSGILLHGAETGRLEVAAMSPDGSIASWLMLLGVVINAAVPPLHTWLSDAYPRATVTGAVFLSAFTTKTAVYVLLRMFAGWEILLVLGTIMTLYGVVFAILADDIRGILAYHIISQVGYMVAGAGIGTELAVNGAAAHAFCHILYKALLFMGAGAVIHATGRSRLSELGGLHRSLRPALILYMIAAFSISGFPLFNGFISKSMVVSAAGEAHYPLAMLLLLLASVGTFLSVGLKLPYYTWFGERREIPVRRTPGSMLLGMSLTAAACLLYGIAPGLLYRRLPFQPVGFQPFTIPHLVETVQILLFTYLAFLLFRKRLTPHPQIALDFDWFYRRPAGLARKIFVEVPAEVFLVTDRLASGFIKRLRELARNPWGALRGDLHYRSFPPNRYRLLTRDQISILLAVLVLLIIFGLALAG